MTALLKDPSPNKSLANNPKTIYGNDFVCVLYPENTSAKLNYRCNMRLLLTTKQQVYSLMLQPNEIDTEMDQVVLYFDLTPTFFVTNQLASIHLAQLQKRQLFYRELATLQALIEATSKASLLRQTAMTYQLITDIIDMQRNLPAKESRKKTKDSQILTIVDDILTKNICGNLPTIDNIAATVGISGSKLKIIYRLQYKTGLYQHYLNLKFETSKELLRHNSVGDTAQIVGFMVTSKFIVGFKKRYNITPYKFKQSLYE
jgi:AraC-like DNA-binding protein